MKMQFNTLPDKLIECALWCVWKYEDRDEKPTKVPYNPRTGGRAQSTRLLYSGIKSAVESTIILVFIFYQSFCCLS